MPVWEAFGRLTKQRTRDLGEPEPLQVSEIVAWFEAHGIDDVATRELWTDLLLTLDDVWFEDYIKRLPPKEEPSNADPSGRDRRPRRHERR